MDELIDGYRRQLVMARYAMHRVRIMQYRGLPLSIAEREYNNAMANYDEILGLAITEPARIEVCEADMGLRFHLGDNNHD